MTQLLADMGPPRWVMEQGSRRLVDSSFPSYESFDLPLGTALLLE